MVVYIYGTYINWFTCDKLMIPFVVFMQECLDNIKDTSRCVAEEVCDTEKQYVMILALLVVVSIMCN